MLSSLFSATLFRVFGAGATFLLSVVVARQFETDEAGKYFIALSVIAFMKVFGLGGMHSVGLKLVSKYNERQYYPGVKRAVYLVSIFSIISITFSSLLLFFASDYIAGSFWHKPEMAKILRIIAFLNIFSSIAYLYSHFLQGLGKSILAILFMNIAIPVLTLAIIFVFSISQVHVGMNILLVASALTAVAAIYTFHAIGISKEAADTELKASEFLWTAGNLWLVGVLVAASQNGMQFISAIWLDSSSISLLAVAIQLATVLSFLLASMNFVLAPKISGLYHLGDFDELRKYVWKGVSLLIAMSLPLVALLTYNSEWLFLNIFGNQYSDASAAFRVLVLGQLVNVLVGPVGYMLSMTGHDKDLRNISIISSVLGIIGSVVLVPLYGLMGAAAAISLSVILYNFMCLAMVKYRMGFFTVSIWRLWN